jgi:hypothetical protein
MKINKIKLFQWHVGEFLIFKIFHGGRLKWIVTIIENIFDIDVTFRKAIQ